MKLKAYAVKDKLVNAFPTPFYMQSEALAIRGVKEVLNGNTPNALKEYPEDKELWYLGEYNTETGETKNDLTRICGIFELINYRKEVPKDAKKDSNKSGNKEKDL